MITLTAFTTATPLQFCGSTCRNLIPVRRSCALHLKRTFALVKPFLEPRSCNSTCASLNRVAPIVIAVTAAIFAGRLGTSATESPNVPGIPASHSSPPSQDVRGHPMQQNHQRSYSTHSRHSGIRVHRQSAPSLKRRLINADLNSDSPSSHSSVTISPNRLDDAVNIQSTTLSSLTLSANEINRQTVNSIQIGSNTSTSLASGGSNYHAALPDWSKPGARRGPPKGPGGLGASSIARMASTAARAPSSTTVGLVGVGAMTSGSVLIQRMRRQGRTWLPSNSDDRHNQLHNECTVVCMQIPFCVHERGTLLTGLNDLIQSQSCRDAAGIAHACRAAARLLQAQTGVMEDSRRFAPHVDMFLAESIKEAERRFSAHVTIEASRIDRVSKGADDGVTSNDGDYGVVTMVVATTEGVDLHCFDEGMTNCQRLRSALDAVGHLQEGQVSGLELVWVPEDHNKRSLSRSQMLDAYPSLSIA